MTAYIQVVKFVPGTRRKGVGLLLPEPLDDLVQYLRLDEEPSQREGLEHVVRCEFDVPRFTLKSDSRPRWVSWKLPRLPNIGRSFCLCEIRVTLIEK